VASAAEVSANDPWVVVYARLDSNLPSGYYLAVHDDLGKRLCFTTNRECHGTAEVPTGMPRVYFGYVVQGQPPSSRVPTTAAFGDTVTFGGTEQIRRLISYSMGDGDRDLISHCTVFYEWGGHGGDIANVGLAFVGGVGAVQSALRGLEQSVALYSPFEAGLSTAQSALHAEPAVASVATEVVGEASAALRSAAEAAGGESVAITKPYVRPSAATTTAQRASVQGQPCVDCGAVTGSQVADHIDPLVKEYYRTGAIDLDRMRSLDAVQPQCPTCSARQGADLSRYSREMRRLLGLDP